MPLNFNQQDSRERYVCVANGESFEGTYVNDTNIICSNVTFQDPPGVAIEFVWNVEVSWNNYRMNLLESIEGQLVTM